MCVWGAVHERSLLCTHPKTEWVRYSDGCEGRFCEECLFPIDADVVEWAKVWWRDQQLAREAALEALERS